MAIPAGFDPIWKQLINGQKRGVEFECLAVKITLGRLRIDATRDPTSLPKLAAELHELFVKNEMLPSLQRDLKKLAV
jgi:hypothetical protein